MIGLGCLSTWMLTSKAFSIGTQSRLWTWTPSRVPHHMPTWCLLWYFSTRLERERPCVGFRLISLAWNAEAVQCRGRSAMLAPCKGHWFLASGYTPQIKPCLLSVGACGPDLDLLQVYLYATVDYATRKNHLNRMTVYDKIITSANAAHIQTTQARIQFPFTMTDQGRPQLSEASSTTHDLLVLISRTLLQRAQS